MILPGGTCPCKKGLPWHLHGLGLTGHTCSCGRHFKVDPEGFEQDSPEPPKKHMGRK